MGVSPPVRYLPCVVPCKLYFTEGTTTTNASIKFFTQLDKLDEIVGLSAKPITFSYNDDTAEWKANSDGQLRLLFQKEENGYQARSFEDAFINRNLQFIIDNETDFTSLKNISILKAAPPHYYDIAEQCIESKTSFALDILLYGGVNNEGWTTPLYIKEGLEWLAQ